MDEQQGVRKSFRRTQEYTFRYGTHTTDQSVGHRREIDSRCDKAYLA